MYSTSAVTSPFVPYPKYYKNSDRTVKRVRHSNGFIEARKTSSEQVQKTQKALKILERVTNNISAEKRRSIPVGMNRPASTISLKDVLEHTLLNTKDDNCKSLANVIGMPVDFQTMTSRDILKNFGKKMSLWQNTSMDILSDTHKDAIKTLYRTLKACRKIERELKKEGRREVSQADIYRCSAYAGLVEDYKVATARFKRNVRSVVNEDGTVAFNVSGLKGKSSTHWTSYLDDVLLWEAKKAHERVMVSSQNLPVFADSNGVPVTPILRRGSPQIVFNTPVSSTSSAPWYSKTYGSPEELIAGMLTTSKGTVCDWGFVEAEEENEKLLGECQRRMFGTSDDEYEPRLCRSFREMRERFEEENDALRKELYSNKINRDKDGSDDADESKCIEDEYNRTIQALTSIFHEE